MTDPDDERKIKNLHYKSLMGQGHLALCSLTIAHLVEISGVKIKVIMKKSRKFYYVVACAFPSLVVGMVNTSAISNLNIDLDQKYTKQYERWLEDDKEFFKQKFENRDFNSFGNQLKYASEPNKKE